MLSYEPFKTLSKYKEVLKPKILFQMQAILGSSTKFVEVIILLLANLLVLLRE
jgi:hypothetical protein